MPDLIGGSFEVLCTTCGKNRFAHLPDPPDGYWPECTTFVSPVVIDAAHIEHQREWSAATFGPAEFRTPLGPLDHLKKELKEVEAKPYDLEEWVDVIILGFDGAWRAGHQPQEIIDAIKTKQAKNEARVWPDWRGSDPTVALEHDRSHDG